MVSREEFIAMRKTIRLFVKDAKCQEMLIEVLAGLVAARWKVVIDNTSVSDKTTEVYPYIYTPICVPSYTDIYTPIFVPSYTDIYIYTDMCTDIIRQHLRV
jgi:hypothetical protein